MRGNIKAALILTLPLLMIGTVLGGEGVQVKITNDGAQDIVVTVYDMNAKPRAILLQNARINGFTSAPVFHLQRISCRDGLATQGRIAPRSEGSNCRPRATHSARRPSSVASPTAPPPPPPDVATAFIVRVTDTVGAGPAELEHISV